MRTLFRGGDGFSRVEFQSCDWVVIALLVGTSLCLLALAGSILSAVVLVNSVASNWSVRGSG